VNPGRFRLNPSCIDVYGLYRLMFPKDKESTQYAADAFMDAVEGLYSVVRESSQSFGSKKFKFEAHRDRMVMALGKLHITMEKHARIDFLEVEDELLNFIEMLVIVFAPYQRAPTTPDRTYR
jgi:hypothetical protein